MPTLVNSLDITAYKSIDSFVGIGTYSLQLNPSDISFDVGKAEAEVDESLDAEGSAQTSRAITFIRRKVQFKFIIDNTGVLPSAPDGVSKLKMGSVSDSIKKLEKLTILPVESTHRPPFVKVSWGMGMVSVFGSVVGLNYKYTYFNALGVPLRAEVTLIVVEVELDGKTLFQSPDITKSTLVKDGDSIVSISEKFYDAKKYYLKIARLNGLASFRNLKKGSNLEIPPIKNEE